MLIVVVIWMFNSAIINSNPYKTYMDDCNDLHRDDPEFKYNSTCFNGTLTDLLNENAIQVDCQIVDYEKLKKFCHNNWNEG